MTEIIIDESSFTSAAGVHAYLATELAFPDYYGANLDALSDCLDDLCEPCAFTVYMNDAAADEDEFAAWFPKLVRVLLRSARNNDAIDVLVHATSLRALGRLAACRGMCDLLDGDMFVTQGLVACLHEGDNDAYSRIR